MPSKALDFHQYVQLVLNRSPTAFSFLETRGYLMTRSYPGHPARKASSCSIIVYCDNLSIYHTGQTILFSLLILLVTIRHQFAQICTTFACHDIPWGRSVENPGFVCQSPCQQSCRVGRMAHSGNANSPPFVLSFAEVNKCLSAAAISTAV